MTKKFSTFADVIAHLDCLGLFHVNMGLDRMNAAINALLPPKLPFRVVQILGTNGKGSTSAFLAAIASAHGCVTGLYTSPHFVSPEERIKILDNRGARANTYNSMLVIGNSFKNEWVKHANRIIASVPDLTYFEFLTVLALLIFESCGVEVAVMEAGLGGRHDATTAIPADIICYTPIALDHTEVLGHDLESIARDKAAAIRDKATVCTSAQFPAVAKILSASTYKAGCRFVQAGMAQLPEKRLLYGQHQAANAGLALAAWLELAPAIGAKSSPCLEAEGLARAFMPGRLQSIPKTASHPALLLDGAHNPHGMLSLVRTLEAEKISPSAVIFSCLADKDWPAVVSILHNFLTRKKQSKNLRVIVPALDNPRAADVRTVAEALTRMKGLEAIAVEGHDAVARAIAMLLASTSMDEESGPVLITGSLYLLADFFTCHPCWLEAQGQNQTNDCGHTDE